MFLYVKNPFESNYHLHINRREKIRIKMLKIRKAFLNYLQTTDDVYEDLEDYNPTKKTKLLLMLDYMLADMKTNKKLSPILTELFLRGRKLNISLVFISQSCFKVPKTIRLNAGYHFISKNPYKR